MCVGSLLLPEIFSAPARCARYADIRRSYIAALNILAMAAPLLLNKIFDTGENIGPVLAYTMALLMAVELGYVFVKYVITSNK